MELVFATNNRNKMKEVAALLPKKIQVLTLEEIGCTEDIPETAETIEGNALQKMEYVKQKYRVDCFADDTGLEVEALEGKPGVLSARYAGPAKDSEANIQKLLQKLKGKTSRKARFKTVIALHFRGQNYTFEGICNGSITEQKMGTDGFGYDAIFQPEGASKTFAEMELSEKSKLSHRGIAVRKLCEFLSQNSL